MSSWYGIDPNIYVVRMFFVAKYFFLKSDYIYVTSQVGECVNEWVSEWVMYWSVSDILTETVWGDINVLRAFIEFRRVRVL